jgi:stage II sporulation protein R
MEIWKAMRGAITGIVIGLVVSLGICTVLTVSRMISVVEQKNQGEGATVSAALMNAEEAYGEEAKKSENIQAFGNILASETVQEDLGTLASGTVQEDLGTLASETVQEDRECLQLQDKILRFHVRANSNSEEDIALKYTVRDRVLTFLSDKLAQADSKTTAMDILYQYLPEIQAQVEACIQEEGYDYEATVALDFDYFPMRQYGDLVLPAGTYDALTIEIGEGAGENFWCMLYPAICFTTDSAAVVDEASKEALRETLTEEEYREVFIDTEARADGRVHMSLWLLSLFR